MSTPAETAVTLAQPVAPAVESAGGFIGSIDSFFDPPPVAPAAAPVAAETTPAAPEPAKAPEAAPEPVKAKEEPTPTKAADEKSKLPEGLEDLDTVDDVKSWTPEAARRFKELKSELKSVKSRAAELEATAAQHETRAKELEALASNPEYQQLQDRIAEYEGNMMLQNLEQSTAYKALVAQPLADLVSESDAIAAKYSIAADDLLDVISMTDETAQEERLTEVLAAASDRDKFKIYQLVEKVKPILAQREVLRQNVEAALQEAKALDEVREKKTLAERATTRSNAAASVLGTLKDKIPMLSTLEGLNLDDVAKAAAETDPSTLNPVTGAYQAMAAKIVPHLVQHNHSLQAEIDELTSQLAKYEKATPAAGGGPRVGIPNAGVSLPPARSFEDSVNAAFGGI